MRASRLISMLVLCRTRSRWTAAELAEELEVSVRTVYRDVAELQTVGAPLWTESGPGGGIRLLPGWRSEVDGLTVEEAAALALSGVPSAVSDLGLGTVALSARLKVRSTLPPGLRTRAARIEERFHLDAPGWFHRSEDLAHLGTIAEAVWSERRIDVTYERADRRARRRLDPLGLVLKAGTWYLVAQHRSEVRTYRVGRIRSCAAREDTFARPAAFDLAAWWSESSADFDRSLLRYRCRLALSPRAQRHLVTVTDDAAARRALHDARSLPEGGPAREGWSLVDLDCESEVVAAGQLLGLGAGVEVIAPESLRCRLHELGAKVAEVNRPRTRPGATLD